MKVLFRNKQNMKIEIESYNMEIKTLPSGAKVAQIKPSVAFNDEFINEVIEKGVKEYVKQDNQE